MTSEGCSSVRSSEAPLWTDPMILDVTLTANGIRKSTRLYSGSPNPYDDLVDTLAGLFSQETLYARMQIPKDRAMDFYDLETAIRALQGERVSSGHLNVLNWERYEPMMKDIADHPAGHSKMELDIARKLLDYVQAHRPATGPATSRTASSRP